MTARVSGCQVSPAPVFACQPTGGNALVFTPGGAEPRDITCSCEAPSTGQISATLSCEETSPLAGGAPPVLLFCPGDPGMCGDLTFSPNPGPIQSAGGEASIGVSHSGGSIANDNTFNGCNITGAKTASYGVSNAPINFEMAATNNIAQACTNTTAAPVQATFS